MPVNLHDKRIGEFMKYLGWILLFVFLWLKGCSSDCGNSSNNVKVTVPEVKGSFNPKQPDHVPVTGKMIKGQNLSNSDKSKSERLQSDSLISELLAENERLSKMYCELSQKGKDSAYHKAIQLNSFSDTFEDKNIKIDISGIVRGEVKSIQPFYTIKEREIKTEIGQKEVKFRMLAGGSVGNSIDFQKPLFTGNLGFQNKKGNIIRIGFDTDKRIIIGYEFSVFKIEK